MESVSQALQVHHSKEQLSLAARAQGPFLHHMQAFLQLLRWVQHTSAAWAYATSLSWQYRSSGSPHCEQRSCVSMSVHVTSRNCVLSVPLPLRLPAMEVSKHGFLCESLLTSSWSARHWMESFEGVSAHTNQRQRVDAACPHQMHGSE